MLSVLRGINKTFVNKSICFENVFKAKSKIFKQFNRSFLKKTINQNSDNLSESPDIKSLFKPFLFTVSVNLIKTITSYNEMTFHSIDIYFEV